VSAANPIAMLPESARVARALENLPFLVVVDSHETDTTRRADVVLPAATMLETEDVCGAYGHHWIQKMIPVIPPMGGSKTDLEILQALASRMGLEKEMAGSASEWIDRFLSKEAKEKGLTLQALDLGPVRNPLAPRVLFEDARFSTPTGQPQLLDHYPPPPKRDTLFPLALFSNSHRKSQSSQWVGEEEDLGLLEARIHPLSASEWENGAMVSLVSPVGRLRVRLLFDPSLQEGIILVPKGGSLDFGRAANVLVPAVETDIGGGAAYQDARVRIEGPE
jgi:anaerobic selenocysteine-containing dehydrogenase